MSAEYGRGPGLPSKTPGYRDGTGLGRDGEIGASASVLAVTTTALRRAEALNAVILAAAFDCIICVDQAGIVTEFGPMAERLFSCDREQALGRNLADLVALPCGSRASIEAVLASQGSRRHGTRSELTAIRSDGSGLAAEFAVTRVDIDGDPAFCIFLRVDRDGSSADEPPDARLAAANAERWAALDALTASISHEVNQPLSGIITNASACLRMLASDPPDLERARITAQRTIRDANRASDLFKRLRAPFARKGIQRWPIDLHDIVREVLDSSEGAIRDCGALLQVDFSARAPIVMADRAQIRQVIANLVDNALDAMANVTDRPRILSISTARPKPGRVELLVRDTGIGLDEASIDAAFNAFHTTKPGALGIGLSIGRSIAERHGGQLRGASNAGFGASFSLCLPSIDPAECLAEDGTREELQSRMYGVRV